MAFTKPGTRGVTAMGSVSSLACSRARLTLWSAVHGMDMGGMAGGGAAVFPKALEAEALEALEAAPGMVFPKALEAEAYATVMESRRVTADPPGAIEAVTAAAKAACTRRRCAMVHDAYTPSRNSECVKRNSTRPFPSSPGALACPPKALAALFNIDDSPAPLGGMALMPSPPSSTSSSSSSSSSPSSINMVSNSDTSSSSPHSTILLSASNTTRRSATLNSLMDASAGSALLLLLLLAAAASSCCALLGSGSGSGSGSWSWSSLPMWSSPLLERHARMSSAVISSPTHDAHLSTSSAKGLRPRVAALVTRRITSGTPMLRVKVWNVSSSCITGDV